MALSERRQYVAAQVCLLLPCSSGLLLLVATGLFVCCDLLGDVSARRLPIASFRVRWLAKAKEEVERHLVRYGRPSCGRGGGGCSLCRELLIRRRHRLRRLPTPTTPTTPTIALLSKVCSRVETATIQSRVGVMTAKKTTRSRTPPPRREPFALGSARPRDVVWCWFWHGARPPLHIPRGAPVVLRA